MKVLRIFANIETADMAAAQRFYGDILGLDCLMDLGWIATYGSAQATTVQISVASQGGSDTPTPDIPSKSTTSMWRMPPCARQAIRSNTARRRSHGVYAAPVTVAAWHQKKSWALIATRDHNINPDLERTMAKRAGSETIEVAGSHAVYVSKPDDVARLIEHAAKASGR